MIFVAVYCGSVSTEAKQNSRNIELFPGVSNIKTLDQNWNDLDSIAFYSKPQGSRLAPYDWFIHLEQAEGVELFRNVNNIQRLGYIPRAKTPDNPDGLPIGFVRDAPYPDKTPSLGITCAACHTSLIRHEETLLLIDGGPAMGDFEQLLRELENALQKTHQDDEKFARFATRILGSEATNELKENLRFSLGQIASERQAYNLRNLPAGGRTPFGPGRVDAFGAIFNEVAVTFLRLPENHRAADAPVSYPCVWDAPHHKNVQWNGAAENRVSELGPIFFGTKQVGALGRNAGEVLGVFGHIEINETELILPRRYRSTVNRKNLIELEASLESLWSPQWPVDLFGALDEDLKAKGEIIYHANCSHCHKPIDRMAANRIVDEVIVSVGTDLGMIENFGRTAKTGVLHGRRITLTGRDRFGNEAPIGVILKHIVERSILDSALEPKEIVKQLAEHEFLIGSDVINALNPGYRVSAEIEIGDQKLVGKFDLLAQGLTGLKVEGGRFYLMDKETADGPSQRTELIDLQTEAGIATAKKVLKSILQPKETENEAEAPVALIQDAAVLRIGYKARPLNGIWATAPYLHNGSVPTLAELLLPECERTKQFHVGSIEFDKDNVGFKSDPTYPVFATRLEGNSNKGHNFAANLSKEERRQLLEFLKSL
jgi:hypothetical protein